MAAGSDGGLFDVEPSGESASVVDVVDESMGVAADLLSELMYVLDTAVRCPSGEEVGEDLGTPAFDRAGLWPGQFGDVGGRDASHLSPRGWFVSGVSTPPYLPQ